MLFFGIFSILFLRNLIKAPLNWGTTAKLLFIGIWIFTLLLFSYLLFWIKKIISIYHSKDYEKK